jgi:hypothetical protein
MKRALIILSFLGLSATAHAGLFIEPYVGYEFGSVSELNSSSTSHSLSGPAYGARLGYMSMIGFGLGAEYMGTSLAVSSTNPSESASGSDIGAFVSFNFPVFLKVYATYFVSSTASVSNVSGGSYSGSGYKIGVGWTSLPFININFEVIGRDYGKQGGSSLTSDVKENDFCLNISLPIP